MSQIKPFEVLWDDAAVAAVLDKVRAYEWPAAPQAPDGWNYGCDEAYLKRLCAHWTDGYDWRAAQTELNRYPQFTTRVEDFDLHFVHVIGEAEGKRPLLLSHGWPGSVLEFLDVIPKLTDPARFGGDPADAFTVVAPSLPGYPLSFEPGQPRFAVDAIARTFHALMTEVLGYRRYGAQGGDWGSFVTALLGANQPGSVVGIHLNMLPVRRDAATVASPTPEEARWLAELDVFLKEETGYQWIQGTRPQTLAAALTDSPAGLAAWLFEKFQRWTDCDGDPRRAIGLDTMLADISLYWFTGAIGASFWPYYARLHGRWPIADGSVRVPAGYAAFPKEILRPPRSVAQKVFVDLRRWTVMPRGGHFAALEQPAALAHEIVEFFRPLRG